ILADDDDVDAGHRLLDAGIRLARAHAGVEVELVPQGHVHAAKPRADGGGDGALQGHLVPADRFEDVVGKGRAVLLHLFRARVVHFPLDLDAGGINGKARRFRKLGTDAVAGDQGDSVLHAAASSLQSPLLDLAAHSPFVAFQSPSERLDRKSTRLNSSHVKISYAVFCLKKKTSFSN